MSFYEDLRDNTATALITEFGSLHTFTRVTKGIYDPVSGSSVGDTSATFTANAVREEISAFERQDSSIKVDDVKLLAEAVGNGFKIDDQVTIDSQEYKLVMVDPIKPGSVVVAWRLQARK